MPRAIVLNPTDNVATLLDSGRKGGLCVLEGERSGEVSLLEDVAFGHKVCIAKTAAGTDIRKYGQVIGKATRAIAVGEHAHVHNVESGRRSRLEGR
jgi:altronate dehydratase small subunit